MSTLTPPTRVRIHSHVTQSRFLHVEDALDIGKIRLFAGAYRRGAGLQQHAHHFIDIVDARIVFDALARAEPDFNYREYKGTPTDNGAVSRVLSVQVKGENVYVELKSGPGKLTPTGAVTPAAKATIEVNVGLKLYEARRLGAAVLAYLRAWDVMQMLEYRDAIGQPPPYLIVPASSDGIDNGRGDQEAASQSGTTGVPGGPAALSESESSSHANGSTQAPNKAAAVARARQTAEELFGSESGTEHLSKPRFSLRYGNRAQVDASNSVEVQTFRRFVDEKRTVPASRSALQAFYRQHSVAH